MDFNTLARLRNYLTIKHHIPGRIRIKFAPGILAEPLARELMQSRPALPPGVRDVRLNAAAWSVVIEYDARHIPPAMLEELLHAADDARAAELLAELDAMTRTIT